MIGVRFPAQTEIYVSTTTPRHALGSTVSPGQGLPATTSPSIE